MAISTQLRTLALGISFAGVLRPQALPGWSFWDASDGMAESYTSGIVETRQGTWIKHGRAPLNLFDGYQVTMSTNPDALGQPRGAPDGTLWLWSGTGLRRFHSNSWATFPVPEVTSLGSLRLGSTQTWFFTSNRPPGLSGRISLGPISMDRVLILLPDRILEFNAVLGRANPVLLAGKTQLNRFLAIYPCPSGGFWIAGRDGLGRLSQDSDANEDGIWHWSGLPPPPRAFSDFSDVAEDTDAGLFVTAYGHDRNTVLRFSSGQWRAIYSSQAPVLRGWPGNEGSVWILDGNRILELASGRANPVEKLSVLAGIVHSVQMKQDGIFWVGTSQGVARYAPPLWRKPAGLEQLDEVVSAITEDRSGRLWFAATSALISFDNQKWRTFPLPKGHETWSVYTESLAVLPDGRIALRTTASNLLTFDPQTRQFGRVRHPEGREIGLFVPHPEGILMQSFDPQDHAHSRFEVSNGRTFRTLVARGSGGEEDDLRHMRLDTSGDLWAGRITGFEVYRRGQSERQGIAQGYTDSGCYLIYQTPSGTLYAGGLDSLFVRDGRSWRAIQHGLDRVRSMAAARDGTLWVASGTGIHRYRNGNWISNGAEEGLPSSVAYRVFEDSRGRIWAGTTRGIALYHPDTDRDPPVTAISAEQNADQVAPEGEARLVFSGVDKWKQTLSSRLLFSWRLDHGPWSPFSPATYALFKHLPIGARLFEVRAMDRNGNSDPHPATFRFSVVPPWYRNSAFQLIAGFSFVCIIALLMFATVSYRHRGRLIAELHRKKRLEADRQVILEMVARRKPLRMILQRIARSISVNCPGALSGIIRINDGKLDVEGEPQLPEQLRRELASLPADCPFDALWARMQLAASRHGLNACHFSPIRSGDDELLGAIAVFQKPQPSRPGKNLWPKNRPRTEKLSPLEIPIITAMSNLAGTAVDNARLYERLSRQAGHDPLTGLSNRLTFETELQDALAAARRDQRPLAVFFLDLDRFKQINDSLGHRAGDLFLKQIACKLSNAIPPGEKLARIGGDEFTIFLQQRADPAWVAGIADRVLETVRTPCLIEGHEVSASASIGISLFPQDGEDPAALQRHADSAMYRAKFRGKDCYEFFTTLAGSEAARRLTSRS